MGTEVDYAIRHLKVNKPPGSDDIIADDTLKVRCYEIKNHAIKIKTEDVKRLHFRCKI